MLVFMLLRSRDYSRTNARNMVQQTDAEFTTGNVDDLARYFNYLRTLADLTAMASIVAVQVQWL